MITTLLHQWREGDQEALGHVYSVLYDELRGQARACMRREAGGHTLQTTALVHEVFLRLAGPTSPDWQDRTHFLAVAARAMRRVLIDLARSRKAGKRGAGAIHVPLDSAVSFPNAPSIDFEALDDAIERLSHEDPRKAQVQPGRVHRQHLDDHAGSKTLTDSVLRSRVEFLSL